MNTIKEIEFIVVPNDTIGTNLLLGRNFYNTLNIKLCMDKRTDVENITQDNRIIHSVFPIKEVLQSTQKIDPETQNFSTIRDVTTLAQIENYNSLLTHRPPLDIFDGIIELPKAHYDTSVHISQNINEN